MKQNTTFMLFAAYLYWGRNGVMLESMLIMIRKQIGVQPFSEFEAFNYRVFRPIYET